MKKRTALILIILAVFMLLTAAQAEPEQETPYIRLTPHFEAGPDGASYNYRIEDDVLYIQMDDEWVEYDKEERDD